jgi:hypothetical protein
VANKHGIDCKGNYSLQRPILPLILTPEAGMQMAVNVFELAGAHKLIGDYFIAPNYSVAGYQLVVEFHPRHRPHHPLRLRRPLRHPHPLCCPATLIAIAIALAALTIALFHVIALFAIAIA